MLGVTLVAHPSSRIRASLSADRALATARREAQSLHALLAGMA